MCHGHKISFISNQFYLLKMFLHHLQGLQVLLAGVHRTVVFVITHTITHILQPQTAQGQTEARPAVQGNVAPPPPDPALVRRIDMKRGRVSRDEDPVREIPPSVVAPPVDEVRRIIVRKRPPPGEIPDPRVGQHIADAPRLDLVAGHEFAEVVQHVFPLFRGQAAKILQRRAPPVGQPQPQGLEKVRVDLRSGVFLRDFRIQAGVDILNPIIGPEFPLIGTPVIEAAKKR